MKDAEKSMRKTQNERFGEADFRRGVRLYKLRRRRYILESSDFRAYYKVLNVAKL